MNHLQRYLDALNLVYKDNYFDIVDLDNNLVHVSPKLATLLNIKATDNLPSLDSLGFDLVKQFNQQIKAQNKKVIESGNVLKFMTMAQFGDGIILARGMKYPLYDDERIIVGILTLLYPANSIHLDRMDNLLENNDREITSVINGYDNLNSLEHQVLFYYSLGLKQSEVFEFIKERYSDLSLYTFKYYQSILLKKFDAPGINELIESVEELKSRRFMPKELVKNLLITFD
jgi:hypothetical protein